jgi:hypothetical protein
MNVIVAQKIREYRMPIFAWRIAISNNNTYVGRNVS